MVAEGLFVDFVDVDFVSGNFTANCAHRVDQLGTPAVVDCQVEPHAVVGRAHSHGLVEFRQDLLGDICPLAQHAHSDIVVHNGRAFFDHVLFEQVHQEIDFLLRAFPIFARKAVERQLLDAQPRTFLGDLPNRIHSATMPLDAR